MYDDCIRSIPIMFVTPGSQQFYIEAGIHHVSQLFVATFEGDASINEPSAAILDGDGDGENAKDDQVTDALDELALDESRAYKQKISKYIRSSLACVKDMMFFSMMLVGHKCREPLLHHYRFLCKKLTPTSIHVVELVTYHLDTICTEFDALLGSFFEWVGNTMVSVEAIPTCNPMTESDRMAITLGSLAILLHNAGCFDRRIVNQFGRRAT